MLDAACCALHAADSATSGSVRRQRSWARGARGGRLAPGEKRRLKRAKVDAKRAARAAAHGFDAAAVVAQLEDFVQGGGDVKVGARRPMLWSAAAGRRPAATATLEQRF